MYDMHRHFCVRYAYYPLWYAYRLCPICVHIYCMHIGHGQYAYQVLSALICISDMDDCPLYRYRLCPICIPEQVVCISDTDDICIMDNCPCLICIPGQIVLGTHIIHVQYAYYLLWYAYRTWTICAPEQVVCISDTDDMRTTCSGTHIGHGQYAYTFYLYAYRLCPICAPEQVVCISDTDDMRTTCSGTHIVCV